MTNTSPVTAEMSPADHTLLCKFLEEKKPHKLLEIGVSAGGTTRVLLGKKPVKCPLYSVDISEMSYRYPSRKTGFLAEEIYSPTMHGQWNTFWGKDISECLDGIGPDTDFVVLDTTHCLPGEFLSFLAVLPYLHDESVLFLHDISLHVCYKENDKTGYSNLSSYARQAYCTSLLFNAIRSSQKFHTEDILPNGGVILIDKAVAKDNIYDVFNILCMDWHSFQNTKILNKTRKIIARHYDEKYLKIFDLAVLYNAHTKAKDLC